MRAGEGNDQVSLCATSIYPHLFIWFSVSFDVMNCVLDLVDVVFELVAFGFRGGSRSPMAMAMFSPLLRQNLFFYLFLFAIEYSYVSYWL